MVLEEGDYIMEQLYAWKRLITEGRSKNIRVGRYEECYKYWERRLDEFNRKSKQEEETDSPQ